MSLAGNLVQIANDISFAVSKRRKDVVATGTAVKVVAVTKNQEVSAVREVIDAGAAAIGENRVQEAVAKLEHLDRQVERHLIGHLQTNKVRQAVPLFDLIHSVDSESLAREIDRIAGKLGKRQDVLIQVNAANEDSKYGIEASALPGLAQKITQLEHVRLCGLMTIAPFFVNPEDARPVFRAMYELFTQLKAMALPGSLIEQLSMGMTNDYSVAVEEGANLVRIGTAIFGPRH
ncbi:MAG: YggS family pyridoxal phosphate-dependent enzyme [Negativicutes bacterium]|nr:YggS family pyridoxal phosphate-dependent enzyme [Negativicutes bacterium]